MLKQVDGLPASVFGQGGVFAALLVMDKVEADGLLVVSQRIDLLDHTVGASSMAWMMPSLSSM
ncbi:MAG: hypothetical protein OGM81_03280 [Oscillospiraceae bacterium]|nr:MAG: hypothetical protein OGM81_03280 [Oscillospiraceae bacterium]